MLDETMRLIYFMLALALLSGPFAPAFAQDARPQFVIGEQYRLRSTILDEDRTIWVRLPQSYARSKAYRRYPVLYVLDGDLFFHPFTGVVQQLSSDATPLIPEMIVVGIDSVERVRDSTPSRSRIGPNGRPSEDWAASGGGEAFQRHLEQELVPFVDSTFSTNGYRLLAGYSLTGLPVAYNLFTRPGRFNAHIVLDGALWWDDAMILRLAQDRLARMRFDHQQLVLVTTAQRYPAPYITVEPGGRELAALLAKQPVPGLHVVHHERQRETHHNLATAGLYDALVSIFDGHMMTLDELYRTPDRIPERFERLSKRLGHAFAPPEGVADFFGYQFLRNLPDQEIDKALRYFTMNTRYYPRSPNAWASLGDGYLASGNCRRAGDAFRHALALQPNLTKAERGLAAIRAGDASTCPGAPRGAND